MAEAGLLQQSPQNRSRRCRPALHEKSDFHAVSPVVSFRCGDENFGGREDRQMPLASRPRFLSEKSPTSSYFLLPLATGQNQLALCVHLLQRSLPKYNYIVRLT